MFTNNKVKYRKFMLILKQNIKSLLLKEQKCIYSNIDAYICFSAINDTNLDE